MAGGSSNPLRQQMINMMYLVLTALLALNVSADILKAFALVNKGLDKTNTSYQDKNELTMKQFQKLYDVDKAKAQQFWDNANKAKATADAMFNYLQGIKERIATRAEGWKEGSDKATVVDDKNTELPTRYFIKEPDNAPVGQKHGDKLRDSLSQFVKQMKSYLGAGNENAVNFKIDTEAPPKSKDGDVKTWVEYYFEGVPAIAAITEITKFQNDVRNAEAEVTNFNMKQVGSSDFKFDNLVAIVTSETPSVSVGQKYKADIYLGAYSSTQKADIYVNGQPQKVENGKATYETVASGMGEKQLDIKIRVPDPTKPGVFKEYPTKTAYQVFTGGATISAEKMNMLYIGLDNPIAASAAGFRPDETVVTPSGGCSWHAAPGPAGHYICKPNPGVHEITVSVSVKMPDKTIKKMGQQVYRVRPVPHPEVLFGTKTGGRISRGELQTVSFINAGLGESFAFEGLKYTINSFTFALAPKSGQSFIEQVSGNRVTQAMRQHFQTARPGDIIVIANVEATGPVGKVQLNGPSLTVF
jgi:gliding motility-associated protein GldM